MEEVWKDVVGYEGLYQVSNLGRVRSLDRKTKNRNGLITKRGRILSPFIYGGYYCIGLSVLGCKHNKKIHRLVAESFLPNPNNYPIINHKDENKLNNNADNLEWCTYSYNTLYGSGIERRRNTYQKTGIGKLAALKGNRTNLRNNAINAPHPVNQYSLDGQKIARYESAEEASRITGIKNYTIRKCCRGGKCRKQKYIWCFA